MSRRKTLLPNEAVEFTPDIVDEGAEKRRRVSGRFESLNSASVRNPRLTRLQHGEALNNSKQLPNSPLVAATAQQVPSNQPKPSN